MSLAIKSLRSRGLELAEPMFQLRVLHDHETSSLPPFLATLNEHGQSSLRPRALRVLQVNIGKMCNQSCKHCHVDAGPDRTEKMSHATMQACIDVIKDHGIGTVDITGGAPEMHPEFRWFVEELSATGVEIIVRCNLTIIMANPKYRDLPQFFAMHRVHVVSSLPFYDKRNTDRQRGDGVYDHSIEALRLLNAVGYGVDGSGLQLDLVYNPVGALLPGPQKALEADFKRELHGRHGIVFNALHCITNMPISRFLEFLIESGNYARYMEKLVSSFNPAAVHGVMCQDTISVGYDGILYDCDFNQMLELPVDSTSDHIASFNIEALRQRTVIVDQHCYGCTAGAGSSCGGQLT